MKTIFTTAQIAKICKVAPRTVSKWFDSGRLRGYRIPGSQDRRIPREHLIRFLKEYGMPLGELEDEAMGKILLVGSDVATKASLSERFGQKGDFAIDVAGSGFEAGIVMDGDNSTECAVIDFAVGLDESVLLAKSIRRDTRFDNTVLIGLVSVEDQASGFDRTLLNETFRKPLDDKMFTLLAERIRTLVNRRKQEASSMPS